MRARERGSGRRALRKRTEGTELGKTGRSGDRPLFFAGVAEPAEVGLGAAGDGEDEEFGSFVGVEAEDFPFEGF